MKALILLFIVGLLVVTACSKSEALPPPEPASPTTGDAAVDSIAADLETIDTLDEDLNLSDLDTLDQDLNFG